MELLSYIASIITTLLGLCEPFSKKRKTVLTLNFLGNVLVGTSYLLISRFSGAAICFAAAIQVLINYCFDAKGKKLPVPLMIVHAAVFLTINLITFSAWYDAIALAAALMFVLSMAQHSTKYYRMLYVANSMLWIVYDTLAKAYGNLFTHVVLFVAITVAIYVRDVRMKKESKTTLTLHHKKF